MGPTCASLPARTSSRKPAAVRRRGLLMMHRRHATPGTVPGGAGTSSGRPSWHRALPGAVRRSEELRQLRAGLGPGAGGPLRGDRSEGAADRMEPARSARPKCRSIAASQRQPRLSCTASQPPIRPSCHAHRLWGDVRSSIWKNVFSTSSHPQEPEDRARRFCATSAGPAGDRAHRSEVIQRSTDTWPVAGVESAAEHLEEQRSPRCWACPGCRSSYFRAAA